MVVPVLLLLAQAAASPPPPPPPSQDVIVVGRRAERDLAACLARQCPPAEEIEATLQASVEQFADGRYADARQTLQRAIERNRQHAAAMPRRVSTLYATLATVAEHEGDTGMWRNAARNNMAVLRKHLGATDPATLTEETHFADDMAGLGAPMAADGIYAKVQRLASENSLPDLAAAAAFRRAWLALMRDRYREAERFADSAVTLADASRAMMTELREILRARIAVRKGDEDAVDALAARLRQSEGAKPMLLFAPSLDDINPPPDFPVLRDDEIRFADIGYWILPDGRIGDAELLRTSGLGQWKSVILKEVRARRYVPLRLPSGQPGLYRIDRFTVRGEIGTPTGSRIRQRMGNLTVHVVDLSETEAMSAALRKRTTGETPQR